MNTDKQPHPSEQQEQRNCEQHGEYMATCYVGKYWSPCPQCYEIERKADRLRQERELIEKQIAGRINSSGIPARFRDRTFDNYIAATDEQQHALTMCQNYVEAMPEVLEQGRCLLLVGKAGTGKTHLASAIALAFIRKGNRTIYTTVSNMLREIKDTYRRDSDRSEIDVIDQFAKVGLLVLDEVGMQHGTDAERNLIFDVLNDRYGNMRPTVILSNCDLPTMEEYLGSRVFDRLRENGGRAVIFDWASYRKEA